MRVLVTGSEGLIGTVLCRYLTEVGSSVVSLDVRGSPNLRMDVRGLVGCSDNLAGISGIVHLAAVSRVVHGERAPQFCESVNIEGTRAVLQAATKLRSRPWVIYASSREVYGEQTRLPVSEDAELKPLNVYARSKLAAEELANDAKVAGFAVSIVRFSNVYGSICDHGDRVIPAFASAAARGGQLRLDDAQGILDFTHVSDVARGVLRLMDLLSHEAQVPPPIHFVSGVPTSLGELAKLAITLGTDGTSIVHGKPRNFDVHHFYGDPSRAAALLGWTSITTLRDGFGGLVDDFSQELRAVTSIGSSSI